MEGGSLMGDEETKYENIIAKYTDTQLLYERQIKLEQYKVIKKELSLIDDEAKKRLRGGK